MTINCLNLNNLEMFSEKSSCRCWFRSRLQMLMNSTYKCLACLPRLNDAEMTGFAGFFCCTSGTSSEGASLPGASRVLIHTGPILSSHHCRRRPTPGSPGVLENILGSLELEGKETAVAGCKLSDDQRTSRAPAHQHLWQL